MLCWVQLKSSDRSLGPPGAPVLKLFVVSIMMIIMTMMMTMTLRRSRPARRRLAESASPRCVLAAGSASTTSESSTRASDTRCYIHPACAGTTSAPWRRSGTRAASSARSAGRSWRTRHRASRRRGRYTAETITRGQLRKFSQCSFSLLKVPTSAFSYC